MGSYYRGGSAFLLVLVLCFLSGCNNDRDNLDTTMRDFLDTVIRQNSGHFMNFVPHRGTWHFVSYDRGGIASNTFLTYNETETIFESHGGLWVALFQGSDEYSYRDRLAKYPLSKWIRTKTTYRIPAEDGVSYVTWRVEDGRWVISVIGDLSP